MRLPIRYQYMVPLVTVAIVSLAAISAVHAWLTTARTRERVERQLQGVAAVLVDSGFPLTPKVLDQMSELAGAEFVLASDSGEWLSSSLSAEQKIEWPQLAEVADDADEVTLGPMLIVADRPYYYSSLELADRRGGSAPQVLHMLFPQDEFNTAWRAMFLPPLAIGAVAIAAVMLATGLVTARINRVLSRLGREVQRLADGDFSAVEVPKVNDETRDLAVAVNQTATRLAEYEAETRRTEQMRTLAILGSGLAHEMRNAATGCRMAIDLHSEECHASTNAANDGDDSLDMARRQLKLMERRLQKFLRLGKETSGDHPADIDLAELVGELVALVQPSAFHSGIHFDWQSPSVPTIVHADAELLSQAVMNLLLNAVDAAAKRAATTSSSGTVRATLSREGELVALTIADSGDGPPRAISKTLFEPFVSDKPEGVGLGLAVARQVADACGGSLEWTREADETRFTLRLPAVKEVMVHV
ncbi:ATP-binding protein [Aeoliella sp. SH292]|uniref:ATP-binding protein n=1 Tax=Aeoliella sp. SH292 TaxID=3454464 RepID=UPI003F9B6B0D